MCWQLSVGESAASGNPCGAGHRGRLKTPNGTGFQPLSVYRHDCWGCAPGCYGSRLRRFLFGLGVLFAQSLEGRRPGLYQPRRRSREAGGQRPRNRTDISNKG